MEGYSGLPTFLTLFGLLLLWFMTKSENAFGLLAYCLFNICLYFAAL
jgi:hypothetical protein